MLASAGSVQLRHHVAWQSELVLASVTSLTEPIGTFSLFRTDSESCSAKIANWLNLDPRDDQPFNVSHNGFCCYSNLILTFNKFSFSIFCFCENNTECRLAVVYMLNLLLEILLLVCCSLPAFTGNLHVGEYNVLQTSNLIFKKVWLTTCVLQFLKEVDVQLLSWNRLQDTPDTGSHLPAANLGC